MFETFAGTRSWSAYRAVPSCISNFLLLEPTSMQCKSKTCPVSEPILSIGPQVYRFGRADLTGTDALEPEGSPDYLLWGPLPGTFPKQVLACRAGCRSLCPGHPLLQQTIPVPRHLELRPENLPEDIPGTVTSLLQLLAYTPGGGGALLAADEPLAPKGHHDP